MTLDPPPLPLGTNNDESSEDDFPTLRETRSKPRSRSINTQTEPDDPRENHPRSGRHALPQAALPAPPPRTLLVGAARDPLTVTTTNITPNSIPWDLAPEHEHLFLTLDISTEHWREYGLDAPEQNHGFKTSIPLRRGDVRILTIHQNMGQNLYVSPTTIEDTLDMAKQGWTFPNLRYSEAMGMLQTLSFPEILGKELDTCVVAWKEARLYESMFNKAATHKELTLRYPSEADFLKQGQTIKYIRENSPTMEKPLKDISAASLERHLHECIKFAMNQGMHYNLWNIVYGNDPNMRPYVDTVKRAAAQFPKYREVLEKLSAFWVQSLKSHVSQNINYESKRKDYLSRILKDVLTGEIASAIVYLRSEAETLKTFNPCYVTEVKNEGLTEELQAQGTEREIRTALLSLLSGPDAPLDHIWQEIVQNHFRENPAGLERGPSGVQFLPLEDLISRFRNACEIQGFLENNGCSRDFDEE